MILLIGFRCFMNVLQKYSKIFAVLLLCIMALAPCVVHAQQVCAPEPHKETNSYIAETFSCQTKTGITYRFTQCVDEILHHVADTGFDKMLKGMSQIVGAVLTIFVALTGAKMVLGGVRNIKGEAITTLLKLTVVSYFSLAAGGAVPGESGLKQAYDLVQGMNADLVDLVSTTLVASGPCNVAANGEAETSLWKRIDCTILVFIGKQTPSYTTETVDLNGDGIIQKNEKDAQVPSIALGEKDLNCDGEILGIGEKNAKGEVNTVDERNVVLEDATLFQIALSQLFTPHGIFILVLLAAAALTLFIAFAKALQVYVIAMVAITFLMLLAPIFIPCFLFARTRQIFITWVSMILAYMIQPAMLMAFLVFMLAALNVALHGDPTNGTPGLTQSLALMNKDMKANVCTRKILVWSHNAIDGKNSNMSLPDFGATFRNLGQEVNAVTVPTTPVVYKDLSIFMVHLIACCVLLYVMVVLMMNVAEFVGSLSVGAGGNLSNFGTGLSQLGGAARDAVNSMLR